KRDCETILSTEIGIKESILNSLRDRICVIDLTGSILFVNNEWLQFALRNGETLTNYGIGMNYLEQFENEPLMYQGLQAILTGQKDSFNFEYPCHSPTIKRWFLMQATPLQTEEPFEGAVIRYVDITKQKLLELQLKELAEQDSLTSLYNHRYFMEQLAKAADNARHDGRFLALLYIDIDNFKAINDTYGHPAGDHVLKELANQLKKGTRFADTVARVGGDEFAVLLPDITQVEVKLIADRLLLSIQRLTIHYQDCLIEFTISIGGGIFTDKMPLTSMMELVDKSLYIAKDKGKNKVVIS
ncbi:MAG: diguanylate cyclase, partial [Planococcus donghaensis]